MLQTFGVAAVVIAAAAGGVGSSTSTEAANSGLEWNSQVSAVSYQLTDPAQISLTPTQDLECEDLKSDNCQTPMSEQEKQDLRDCAVGAGAGGAATGPEGTVPGAMVGCSMEIYDNHKSHK